MHLQNFPMPGTWFSSASGGRGDAPQRRENPGTSDGDGLEGLRNPAGLLAMIPVRKARGGRGGRVGKTAPETSFSYVFSIRPTDAFPDSAWVFRHRRQRKHRPLPSCRTGTPPPEPLPATRKTRFSSKVLQEHPTHPERFRREPRLERNKRRCKTGCSARHRTGTARGLHSARPLPSHPAGGG